MAAHQWSPLDDKNAAYISSAYSRQGTKSSVSTEPKISLLGNNNELLSKAKVEGKKKKSKWVQLPDTGLSETQLRTKYQIKELRIGSGSFASVKIIKEHQTGTQYAIKMVNTRDKSAENINAFKREILFLSQLTNHPNIVKMYDFCESVNCLFMVLEYCNGGDVMQRLQKCKQFTESETKHLCKQIVAGLCYFHGFNIVHRDLKPDNLMYHNGVIKIIDFGLAGQYSHKPLRTPCGTPQYVAPEVLGAGPYTVKADMWSLGCLLFYFISGRLPFSEESGNKQRLFEIIKRGQFSYTSEFNQCSASVTHLIDSLLCVDVQKRLSAVETRGHKWLTEKVKVHHNSKQGIRHQSGWNGNSPAQQKPAPMRQNLPSSLQNQNGHRSQGAPVANQQANMAGHNHHGNPNVNANMNGNKNSPFAMNPAAQQAQKQPFASPPPSHNHNQMNYGQANVPKPQFGGNNNMNTMNMNMKHAQQSTPWRNGNNGGQQRQQFAHSHHNNNNQHPQQGRHMMNGNGNNAQWQNGMNRNQMNVNAYGNAPNNNPQNMQQNQPPHRGKMMNGYTDNSNAQPHNNMGKFGGYMPNNAYASNYQSQK